jgi:diketogulonate reductase-like aldo/keto reductase
VQRRTFVSTLAAMSSIPWPRSLLQEPVVMAKRPIPRTGELIPVIGLGTWQTFDPPAADVAALDNLAEVLRVFFAAGGRVIDSSPMYGRAEEVTGTLLERLSATGSTFLATKIWTDGRPGGERQLEASRRLLHRTRLDLEQVHNLVDWRTQLDLLRREKAEGRLRYVGVTHYTEASFGDLEAIVRREQLDFVQLPYSIGFRAAEARLLPAAAASGTAVLVNMPFEGGSLFAQTRGKQLPDWAVQFAASWAQLFLKFILSNPAVTCVIPATANPTHMRDDVAAGTGPLPDAGQRARLLRFLGL